MVAGFIIVAFGEVSNELLPILTTNIIRQFNASAVTQGIALSIYGLAGLTTLLAIGPFIDRFGPRKVMLIGIPLAGIGFLLLSFVDNIFALNIILGGLLGIGIKAGFLLPAQTATANWFIRSRSIVLAIIMAASILGEAAITLLRGQITNQFDSRVVFAGLGTVILVVCIPLALIFRHRPEQYGYLPDGKSVALEEDSERRTETTNRVLETNFTLRQALGTRAFWLLVIAAALSSGVNTMATIFRIPFLIDADFNQAAIADVFRIAPLMGLAGILLFGYLGDRFPKRYLLAIAIALQSVSVVILMTAGSVVQLYIYTLTYGMGSGMIPLLLAIRADYFGRKAFATITVIMIFIGSLISAPLSMPWAPLAGWIFDATGSYHLVLLLSMLMGFVPATVFFFARPPEPTQKVLTPTDS